MKWYREPDGNRLRFVYTFVHLHQLASTGREFLRTFEALRADFFWPVWCVLTIAFSLLAVWLFRSTPLRAIPARQVRFDRSWATFVPLLLLAVFLCGYFVEALIWEDFAWYDNSQLTRYSLRGIDFPPPIWSQAGRFFPLSNQEFNLLAHFNRTITGYHAVGLAEVLIIVSILLFLDHRISIAGRVVITIFVLMTPTIAVSLPDLIYPERNVVFSLACLAFAVIKFADTHSRWWAIAAVVSAQVALYFKEPVFLLILSFVAARVVFRRFTLSSSNGRFEWFRETESRLDLCLAFQALAFLAFYVCMMFPYTQAEYLTTFRRSSVLEAVHYYVQIDFLVWVFAAVTLARLFLILRRKLVPMLLWDGLACGGLVYFAAYLALRMTHFYYLAPVDLIAGAYLGMLLFYCWPRMKPAVRFAALAIVVVVAVQNLQQTGARLIQRKYVIRRKEAFASMIVARYRGDPQSVRRLYFPFTQGYVLEEFASYLGFRGIPVQEDDTVPPSGAPTVELFASQIPKTGRCIFFTAFVCHAGTPDAPSLTIVLPDDPILPSERHVQEESEANLRAFDPKREPSALFMRSLRFLQRWN